MLIRAALAAKHCLIKSIYRIYPPDAAGVIVGMVFGTYAYLPAERFRDFSRTGTLHLLVASGYNCYVVVFFGGLILKLIRVKPNYRNMVIVVLICAYLVMTGMKPAMLRAAVTTSILLLAVPLRRVPDIKNSFFTAALIILVLSPATFSMADSSYHSWLCGR